MGDGKPLNRPTGWALLTLVAVVAALHFAEDVLIPIALALLLAFLLAPLVDRVQRMGANRPVAVALTTLIAFTLIGALVYAVAHQFLGLVESLPAYRENLSAKIRSVPGPTGGGLERGVETVKELTEELRRRPPAPPARPRSPRSRSSSRRRTSCRSCAVCSAR